MTPERWRMVKSLFDAVVERPLAERAGILAGEPDEAVRREVESLLDAHDSGGEDDLRIAVAGVTLEPHDPATNAGGGEKLHVRLCTHCNSRYGPLERVCPADGTVLVEDPEALVGSTLDGLYHVERLLGQGAMGRVYLARHAILRDEVAIKVLPHDLGSNPAYLKRFLREGRAARAIRHPNAVQVYDLRTTADGLAYMVQEYVEGTTLRSEIARKRAMTVAEALDVLRPVASALDEAHARGVVHRDLKPENVMLGTGRPAVKLLDLGIAKLKPLGDEGESETAALTATGQIVGTPHYMSPEQWGERSEGGAVDVDGRADVYSFAVMAYELVAGRRPFDGQSVVEIMRAHLERPAPRLDEEVPGIPPGVGVALARAMAKDRGARHGSCGDLVAEIEGVPGALTCEARGRAFVDSESPTAPFGSTSRTRPESTAPGERSPSPASSGAVSPASAEARPAARSVPLWVLWGVVTLVVAVAMAAAYSVDWGGAPDPAPAAPAPDEPRSRSLAYTVTVQKFKDGRKYKDPLDVAGGFPFTAEDKIWITVAPNESGCLYAIAEASQPDPRTGEPVFRVLFPDPSVDGGSPRVAGGAFVRIPPEGVPPIDFDDTRGTEKLWLISTDEPVPALDGIAGLLNARDLGRIADPERVAALREILSGPRAEATVDERKRTVVRGVGSLLVTLRELEHY